MRIKLKYGCDGLEVDLPETSGFLGVLAPTPEPVLPDPDRALLQALAAPLGCLPLAELARGKRSACVVVSDLTRPVPHRLLLPPILRLLEENGIAREDILILVATGLHRPNEGAELDRLLGPEITARYRVRNHDARRAEDMVYAGRIGGEAPVYVNRAYCDAELKILTGFIEPHMWAGYSGGRKSILPGISAVETMEYLHGPEMIADARTAYGILEGNPFHEAGLAIMAMVGADFVVNVTLTTERGVTGIFAGDPVKAHLAGCRFLERGCLRELPAPLDFVVTTNAGAPLDCNLYQTVKGMSAVSGALKPGGVILIASACSEGVGSPEYERILDLVDTPAHFLERLLAHEFFIPDQWCAQETYQVMRRNPTWIYTGGIAAERLTRYHFHPVPSIEEAVAGLLRRYGPGASWAVVPDGPMIILRSQSLGCQSM